jgi:hypothetical protein
MNITKQSYTVVPLPWGLLVTVTLVVQRSALTSTPLLPSSLAYSLGDFFFISLLFLDIYVRHGPTVSQASGTYLSGEYGAFYSSTPGNGCCRGCTTSGVGITRLPG